MLRLKSAGRGGWFEGWYFKQQAQGRTIAFIPARHIDRQGRRSASIQIITDEGAALAQFPYEAFSVRRKEFCVAVGLNRFSPRGVDVDIGAQGLHVQGELRFHACKPPRYDIMGPFSLLPMQCRHSVLSLLHRVSGELFVNDESMAFDNASGYIEGDSGSSFPARYLWTQCCPQGERPASLMLSVADIPFASFCFTGVVGFIYMDGKEYRIATYLGAAPVEIQSGLAAVRQGKWLLRAQLLEGKPLSLHAPVRGGMTRSIQESAACRVRYTLLENGRALFDFVSDRAGFECEYGGE